MAYSAALGAVYNHYLTTYAGKGSVSRYDTHKKSELRSIYNSIVKLNKDAPLYILDSSNESRAFAVGLKENARQLHNTIASLGGLEDEKLFSKKTAYSSNEDMVSASFIGEVSDDGEAPSFDIEVTSLASGQVNLGTFLPENAEVSLAPGAYSFDLTINDLSYEFQYNIREGETNRQLQERLVRLVNNADIGVGAELLEDGKGNASLRLSSKSTGLKDGQDTIFQVSDDQTSKQTGTVDYLGIAFLSKLPCNASFLLNGEQRTASSNHFTVDKQFELTLNGIADAPGQKAQIGLKTDLDSLTENVGNLVCPAEFDTGASMNVCILSVPEGDDKPLKYPLMFTICDAMIINKIDVCDYFDFDMEKVREYAYKRNPNLKIFPISAKTGEGVDEWCNWLKEKVTEWNK